MAVSVYAIAQTGRLEFEALLCMASLLKFNTRRDWNFFVCTPANSNLWKENPDISQGDVAGALRRLGVNVVTFENERFGSRYPHSNKMYALAALPPDDPFIFFDSDHVFCGNVSSVDVNFNRPIARQTTMAWPVTNRTTYSRAELWRAVYAKFAMPTCGWFRAEFDEDDPRHFPYFNAGVFFGRAAGEFLEVYRHFMHELDESPPHILDKWSLYPYLDQVTLPLVLRTLGGDNQHHDSDYPFNAVSKHYFAASLLFFPPENTWLKEALDIITAPALRRLFERSDIHNRLFLGDDCSKMNEIARQLQGEGRFARHSWMSNSEIKEYLVERDFWLV